LAALQVIIPALEIALHGTVPRTFVQWAFLGTLLRSIVTACTMAAMFLVVTAPVDDAAPSARQQFVSGAPRFLGPGIPVPFTPRMTQLPGQVAPMFPGPFGSGIPPYALAVGKLADIPLDAFVALVILGTAMAIADYAGPSATESQPVVA
jgi:hypothetical protein